jgi:hypothetical protein
VRRFGMDNRLNNDMWESLLKVFIGIKSENGWRSENGMSVDDLRIILKRLQEGGRIGPTSLATLRDVFTELYGPGTAYLRKRNRRLLKFSHPLVLIGGTVLVKDRVSESRTAQVVRDAPHKIRQGIVKTGQGITTLWKKAVQAAINTVELVKQTGLFIKTLALKAVRYLVLACFFSYRTTLKGLVRTKEVLQHLVHRLDVWITKLDGKVIKTVSLGNELSYGALLETEGILERLPIKRINKDGVVFTKEGKRFLVFDLSGMSGDDIRNIVQELHSIGPGTRFKIIYEFAIKGDKTSEHLKWILGKAEENKGKFEKYSPKAKISEQTILNWYLEVVRTIRKIHRSTRPLLVIPEFDCTRRLLHLLKERRLTGIELAGFLVSYFDRLDEENTIPWMEYRASLESGDSIVESLLPDSMNHKNGFVVSSKESRWKPKESSENRYVYFANYTIYEHRDLTELGPVLLSLVTNHTRSLYMSTNILPVLNNSRRTYIRRIRKAIKAQAGILNLKTQIRDARRLYPKDTKEVYRHVLSEDTFNYWKGAESSLYEIEKRNREAFSATTMNLTIKAYTLEELDLFKKDLELTLKDHQIWFTKTTNWSDQELGVQSILPCITEDQARDSQYTVPQYDYGLVKNLYFEAMKIPKEGIGVGVTTVDGTFVVLDLGLYAGTGTYGSGKSMWAKLVAVFIRLINPEIRVIVVDNSGAAYERTAGLASVTDPKQRGWVNWADLIGGDIVFARNYENNPSELINELDQVRDSRFLLYYPDRQLRELDLAFMKWLFNDLRRFSSTEKRERDIQQVLIVDDIGSWNNDPKREGESRMLEFTQTLMDQCVSTGTMVLITQQTPVQTQKADETSHSIFVMGMSGWFNFQTGDHPDIPQAIGMRPWTKAGQKLMESTAQYLEDIITPGIGSPENPGYCVVSIHNVRSVPAKIIVPKGILNALSRKKL